MAVSANSYFCSCFKEYIDPSLNRKRLVSSKVHDLVFLLGNCVKFFELVKDYFCPRIYLFNLSQVQLDLIYLEIDVCLVKLEEQYTGWVRLIRSLLSATFSFKLSGFSN